MVVRQARGATVQKQPNFCKISVQLVPKFDSKTHVAFLPGCLMFQVLLAFRLIKRLLDVPSVACLQVN